MELYFSPASPGSDSAADQGVRQDSDSRPGGDLDGQPRIDLIQCYDEYVMGYSRTRHFLGCTAPAVPQQDTPVHVVLRDGRMIGSWRHVFAGGRCELDIRIGAVARGSGGGRATIRAIDDAVAAYGRFLEMPVVRK